MDKWDIQAVEVEERHFIDIRQRSGGETKIHDV